MLKLPNDDIVKRKTTRADLIVPDTSVFFAIVLKEPGYLRLTREIKRYQNRVLLSSVYSEFLQKKLHL